MIYVALYRKYRPQIFDDVIGQDHIVGTLRNQILKDKISHAYLFTGTRGTGKTTTAKIFARAVNCPHAKEHNGNPCGKCDVCKALQQPNVDVIEMDAASNNGVDYARDIREKVQYPPVNGRYKVYIIDEVHMLSVSAFNALLKTLEEPPQHALFILCTTEVHKIPATILSRCMRFDFRLVSLPKLAQLVQDIYDKEGKTYEKDALYAIARAGEGSVRDCVSIADRCMSVSDGKLTYRDVMSVLGVSSKEGIANLADAVIANDAGEILTDIDKLVKEGKDVARLSKDLAVYFRDILTVKLCKNPREILALPDDELERLEKQAQGVSDKKLLYAIAVLTGLESSLRYALSPRMLLESATLKIGSSTGEVDVEGLDRRVTRLEQQPHNAKTSARYVVDKTNAQSVWLGVKYALEESDKPLLLGVWRDVKVEMHEDKFVVLCSKGAYLLIDTQYRATLLNEIKPFCNKPVEFVEVKETSETEVDKQLKALGDNVRFENNIKK